MNIVVKILMSAVSEIEMLLISIPQILAQAKACPFSDILTVLFLAFRINQNMVRILPFKSKTYKIMNMEKSEIKRIADYFKS